MTRLAIALLASAVLVGCGGGGISGGDVAECINATGREALFQENEFLVFNTVKVRSADNRASIYLFENADRAQENYESDRFDADPAERAQFKLVGNAEVVWDEVPSADDDAAVTRCLQDS